MKIPEKLKVGATTYSIKKVAHISDSKECVTGRIDALIPEILILENADEGVMRQTLFHEMIHALHYHTGDNNDACPPDERYVEAMANALLMVVKDNPVVFGIPTHVFAESETVADGGTFVHARSVIIDGITYTATQAPEE